MSWAALSRTACSAISASGSPRPGQQHQPGHAPLHGQSGKGADGLDGTGNSQVGIVGDVDRADAVQGGWPGCPVLPVKRRLAGA